MMMKLELSITRFVTLKNYLKPLCLTLVTARLPQSAKVNGALGRWAPCTKKMACFGILLCVQWKGYRSFGPSSMQYWSYSIGVEA